ncbi:16511_t:CDS:1 [Funneliformis geosporum]|uniref:6402_t:CDS:1 n=1 Tax=Funneliformis geosporum TaxID=1117311 RepID=A0A9W4WP76_9GLOM|nr:6402_t:CDS:1 [Funneliformis geosporum]CAI2169440.1 16511_t:CDS:1 [Funneliformis geosporum]
MSYAEVARSDPSENLEANIVIKNDVPRKYHQEQTTEDNYSENRDATKFDKDFINARKEVINLAKQTQIDDGNPRKRSTRGDNEVSKLSKPVVFLAVAVDIALAGVLVGWVYKKPTIDRIKLGFSTVGLSLFYGFQW